MLVLNPAVVVSFFIRIKLQPRSSFPGAPRQKKGPENEVDNTAFMESRHFVIVLFKVSVILIGVPVLTFKSVELMSLSFSFELFGLSSNEISSPTRGSTVR